MEAPPELAVAVAMPVDDPPQIDPALADELGQIDLEADLADDGAMDLLPAPAETLARPEGSDLHKCAALVLWACCERSKSLGEMPSPADILDCWLTTTEPGLQIDKPSVNTEKLDDIVKHVKSLTYADAHSPSAGSHIWTCPWNVTKARPVRSWDNGKGVEGGL